MPRYIGRNIDSTINYNPGDPHWSNVSLLINCDGGSITDVSQYTATVGTSGDPAASTTAPKFGTRSIHLDGNDYLTNPTSSNLNIQSGDWTMEYWMKLGGTWSAAGQMYFGQGANTNDFWHISNHWNTTSDIYFAVRDGGSSWVTSVISSAGAVLQSDSGWHHYAFCNASNTLRIFKNGTQIGSGSFTGNADITNNFFIGAGYGTSTLGVSAQNHYIDDFRLTKGVARYTANFIVPDAAFPVVAKNSGHTENKWNSGVWSISESSGDGYSINTRRTNDRWGNSNTVRHSVTAYIPPATTKLYLPFDEGGVGTKTTVGGIVDNSANMHEITVHGNATVTTAQKKFGTHSLYLDGTGDYLELPIHEDFNTTTSKDLTIEFWYRQSTSVGGATGPYIGFGISASSNAEDILQLGQNASSDTSRIYAIMYNGALGSYAISDTGAVANDSTWRHYSYNYDYSATTMKIYKDGTLIGTDTSFNTRPSRSGGRTNKMFIGATWSTGGGTFAVTGAGHYDDFKFIYGSMLRTGNFTAPTSASGEA